MGRQRKGSFLSLLVLISVGCSNGDQRNGGTPPSSEAFCGETWCWSNPRPHGNHLRAVHGAENAVFAVGDAGTIQQRIAGEWSSLLVAEGFYLLDVWALSPDLAFAVGASAVFPVTVTVLRWDGSVWSEMHRFEVNGTFGPQVTPGAIWARAEDDVHVAFGDHIEHFDGSWSETTVPEEGVSVGDLWGTNAGPVFAVGQNQTAYHPGGSGFVWRYDGTTWVDEEVTASPLGGIDGRSAEDIVAVGKEDILRFNGTAWLPDASEPDRPVDITLAGDTQWVVSTDGIRWDVHRRNASTGWTSLDFPIQLSGSLGPARRFPSLYATASGEELFFAGPQGTLLRYERDSWTDDSEAVRPGAFVNVSPVDSQTVYAAALTDSSSDMGLFARLEDGSWSTEHIDALRSVSRVWASSKENVLVAGDTKEESGPSVLRRMDDAWELLPGLPENVIEMWGSSLSELFVSGSIDEIADVYRFDGTSWARTNAPGLMSVLDGTASNDLYGLSDGSVFHYDGLSWSELPTVTTALRVEIEVMAATAAGEVWVGGGSGGRSPVAAAWRYDGSSWSEASPSLSWPPQPLTAMADLPDGTVYVTTGDRRLLRWSGSSWQEESPIARGTILDMASARDGSLWAVGLNGLVIYRP